VQLMYTYVCYMVCSICTCPCASVGDNSVFTTPLATSFCGRSVTGVRLSTSLTPPTHTQTREYDPSPCTSYCGFFRALFRRDRYLKCCIQRRCYGNDHRPTTCIPCEPGKACLSAMRFPGRHSGFIFSITSTVYVI